MSWPISAVDVRKALGFADGAGDTDDLTLYATAAMEMVEKKIGPHRGQVFSSTVAGPTDVLLLDQRYLTVSVAVDGVTTPYTGSPGDGLIRGPFRGTSITVTAVARATVPALVEAATRELAAIWYRQAAAGTAGRGPGRTAAVGPWVPLGFAMPREIDEKLEPYAVEQLPGIA